MIEYPGTLKEYYRHLGETEAEYSPEAGQPRKRASEQDSDSAKKAPESSAGRTTSIESGINGKKLSKGSGFMISWHPFEKSLNKQKPLYLNWKPGRKRWRHLLADPKIFEDSIKKRTDF